MAKETERKFLVTEGFRPFVNSSQRVVQGYLSSDPDRTVRVRIRGGRGFLTIKGPPDPTGSSRYEWEQEIPLQEAEELLLLCEPGIIEKIRHLVPNGNHVWEVDEFLGQHAGLIMAEVELSTPEEPFDIPAWLGGEVTGNPQYYNAVLKNKGKNPPTSDR